MTQLHKNKTPVSRKQCIANCKVKSGTKKLHANAKNSKKNPANPASKKVHKVKK